LWLSSNLIVEAIARLAAAVAIVELGKPEWAVLSIPLSIFAAFAVGWYFVHLRTRGAEVAEGNGAAYLFPKRFFLAAVVSGLSSNVYLSIDLVFAKHYLAPALAGEYALLSLVGKMIFFFGSLLNGLMITFVAGDEGAKRNPNRTFYLLFSAGFFLTATGYLGLGMFGGQIVPMLLGEKARVIVPYIGDYALAISFFTLANTIVIYHLARRHYAFPIAALLMAGVLSISIIASHTTIADFTNAILLASAVGLGVMATLHFLQRNGRFLLRNLDRKSVV